MNGEMTRICKDVVVVYFSTLSLYLPRETAENLADIWTRYLPT